MKEFMRNSLQKKLGYLNVNRNDRKGALHRTWGYVFTNQIEGDYIEFGVYQGDSFVESYLSYLEFRQWVDGQLQSKEPWRVQLARELHSKTASFHALDTFEGMPANDEGSFFFAEKSFRGNLEKVRAKCERKGLREPQARFYKG